MGRAVQATQAHRRAFFQRADHLLQEAKRLSASINERVGRRAVVAGDRRRTGDRRRRAVPDRADYRGFS
jgi:hypothetical protein